MNQLVALIRVFSYLSILTVGGGMAAFPEMKVLTVEVHKWLTFSQLIHIYSIGQMAPGPNMMMIVVIGQWAAGWVGALVTLLAFFGPTAVLAYVVAKGWRKLEKWPWRDSIQQGWLRFPLACCWRAASPWPKAQSLGSRRNDCGRDSADFVEVQDQSCASGGRGRSCRAAFLPAEIVGCFGPSACRTWCIFEFRW